MIQSFFNGIALNHKSKLNYWDWYNTLNWNNNIFFMYTNSIDMTDKYQYTDMTPTSNLITDKSNHNVENLTKQTK